jgi:predicted dehydrogenase
VVHGVSFVYRQFAMVQQAASMMRNGSVGRCSGHGSYLQDWMLLETDYNWRVDAAGRRIARGGGYRLPLVRYRAVCDRAAHCRGDGGSLYRLADAQSQRGRRGNLQHRPDAQYEDVPVTTEDAGSVLFRFDDGSKGCFSVSQVSAGRKTASG